MADYRAQTQTVGANENVEFSNVVVGCACSRQMVDTNAIPISGGRHLVTFSANVSVPDDGTAGPIVLAITQDGNTIGAGTMIDTPATVGRIFNVAKTIEVFGRCCCCGSTLGVRNIGTTAAVVQNGNMVVTPIRAVTA